MVYFRTPSPFDVNHVLRLMTERDTSNFPFYNIRAEKEDPNRVQLQLALAGYNPAEIEVTTHQGRLTVKCDTHKNAAYSDSDDQYDYHERNISRRSFCREFRLGQYCEIQNVTSCNGILTINIINKVPEERMPKKYEITKAYDSGTALTDERE